MKVSCFTTSVSNMNINWDMGLRDMMTTNQQGITLKNQQTWNTLPQITVNNNIIEDILLPFQKLQSNNWVINIKFNN